MQTTCFEDKICPFKKQEADSGSKESAGFCLFFFILAPRFQLRMIDGFAMK